MSQAQAVAAVAEKYFELIFDPENHRFEDVFHPSAIIKGVDGGTLEIFTAAEYRKLVYGRTSPASTGAPRDEAVLNLLNIAPELAAITVRVRIGEKFFIDHLVVQCIDEKWLITAKAYHLIR